MLKTGYRMIDLSNIPDAPGCYIYRDSRGIIIYIGKAISLTKRVHSYFSGSHDPKTEQLVKNIAKIDFIVTKNEVEALLLENNLIKKHRPKYNIDLKDGKRYAYIQITDESFPRLLIARNKDTKGRFFGPFTSGDQRDRIIKLLRMLFRIRTCRKMPKKPCLRYHIRLCDAPCAGHIDKKDYGEKMKAAEQFLKGDIKALMKGLETKMKRLSADNQFEAAIDIRDTMHALERLSERQNAETQKEHDQDVINYMVAGDKTYAVLLNIKSGTLISKSEFQFGDLRDFLEQFISQYYSDAPVPREIILPAPISGAVREYLIIRRNEDHTKKNLSVTMTVPKAGPKKELLDLAMLNLENSFRQAELSIGDLRKKLRMQTDPIVIECFDISNTQGTDAVGSMVQFRNAKPDKRNYRRFKIRTVEGIDDYSMIQEVVRRRYSRLMKENSDMPDLIMIDGGKGHLHAALDEMKKLGLSIPMISLAKQFEEVYVPGLPHPLSFDRKSYALKLLQRIRDEAHRFAITYHRLLRKKSTFKS